MIKETIRKNRLKLVLISMISVVSGIANIWLLSLINKYAQTTEGLSQSVLIYSGSLVFMVSIGFLSQILLSRLSGKVFYEIRERMVGQISSLNYQQLQKLGDNKLYTALTTDIAAIHDLIILLPNYLFNATIVVSCLVYLGILSIELFLIFALFLAIALVISKVVIVNKGEEEFRKKRMIQDELFKCYKSIIDGFKELNFNKARKRYFIENSLSQHAKNYRDTSIRAEFFWNLANNWNNGVVFVGIGALIFIASAAALASAALMMHFIVVILYMIGPITVLMNSFQSIYNAKVSIEKVASLALADNAINCSSYDHKSTANAIEELEFDAIEFIYPKNEFESSSFSIGPISMSVKRGELLFLVGGNGSGKTTIAKVMSGLFFPSAGEIRVNGEVVTEQNLSKYFDYFSTIFQDYYLFEDIINKSGAVIDNADIEKMLAKLGLADKVDIEGGRILTTQLSYGQRKRLALLLSYFEDSEIYIFDEWAADQDPEFREFFYREFLTDLKERGKTIFVISHDDRYFDSADKVVKFERGKIHSIVDGRYAVKDKSKAIEL